MKNNKGNAMLLVVIAIVVIVIIAIVVMMGNKNNPENVAGNNDTTIIGDEMQKEIKEVKKFKGLEISNIKVKVNNERISVTADVYNPTSSRIEKQGININVLDANGNSITSFTGTIDAVEPGANRQISSATIATPQDRNAANVEITERAE